MVYVPAQDVLQVEIRGTLAGSEIENVLYFDHGSAIIQADVDELFTYIIDDFLTPLITSLGSILAWDELYGTDLTSNTSPTYTQVISPALAGTSASPGLPGNNTCCVSFRTAGRGRSARGRNYFPGVTEADVTGNAIGSGFVNGIVGAYELFLAGNGIPAPWEWVVLSRFLNGVARTTGLIQPVLDVLSTSLTVDSQRKRLS